MKAQRYIVLLLPSFMPLGVELQTLEDARRQISWQCIGQGRAQDFDL